MSNEGGFGQQVTGGGTANFQIILVNNADAFRRRLTGLGNSTTPTVIELVGNPDNFDFKAHNGNPEIPITAKNLTIRPLTEPGPGQRANAVLKNVQLSVDLDQADNILFDGLVFRSDGGSNGARGAITIEASFPGRKPAAVSTRGRFRITRCSFDGYFDIAVDTKSVVGRPKMLMTIDHCLFFDATPGQPVDFINRGAINIAGLADPKGGTLPPLLGDSRVTVANNVFINVWRRCPRVAANNFVHVYNNLLFRWGVTGGPDNTNTANTTWRGMEIGGGDRTEDNGKALIQANRFIPAAGKTDPAKEIATNRGTQIDLAADISDVPSLRPNEFDGPDGKPLSGPGLAPGQPALAQGAKLVLFNVFKLYNDVGLDQPTVPTGNTVDWAALVDSVGSPVFDPAPTLRAELKTVLAASRS